MVNTGFRDTRFQSVRIQKKLKTLSQVKNKAELAAWLEENLVNPASDGGEPEFLEGADESQIEQVNEAVKELYPDGRLDVLYRDQQGKIKVLRGIIDSMKQQLSEEAQKEGQKEKFYPGEEDLEPPVVTEIPESQRINQELKKPPMGARREVPRYRRAA